MSRGILVAFCDFIILSLLSIGVFSLDLFGGRKSSQPGVPSVQQEILSSLDASLKASEAVVRDLETLLQEKDGHGREMEERLKKEDERKKTEVEKARADEAALRRLEEELKKAELSLKDRDARLDQALRNAGVMGEEMKKTGEQARELEKRLSEKDRELGSQLDRLSSAVREAEASRQKYEEGSRQWGEISLRLLSQDKTMRELGSELRKMGESDELSVQETKKLYARLEDSFSREREAFAMVRDLEKRRRELENKHEVLSRSVTDIASRSVEVEEKLLSSRPIASNQLFDEYTGKRLTIRFHAVEPRLLNTNVFDREESAVAVEEGGRTWILLHVDDSPLSWSCFGSGLMKSAGAALRTPGGESSLASVAVLKADPRVAAIPVEGDVVAPHLRYRLGGSSLSFDDAVLIDPRRGLYGICSPQIVSGREGYLRVPSNLKSRLLGRFSPSAGNLVVSRDGGLVGMMVDNEYCLRIRDLATMELFALEDAGQPDKINPQYQAWLKRLENITR